jgi:pimeloyl-ACP methyl ester carboxylesterase
MIHNKSFTSFDGSKIKYSKIGNGKKKVFLVHGLLTERIIWFPYALLFRNDYTFIIIELRGHGSSENKSYPNIKRNPHIDCAEDLHLLSKIELRKGEKAIVAAVSMGNAVVWSMIDSFGDGWVEKYITIDHAIDSQIPGTPRSNIFTKNSEEFWKIGQEITADKIRKDTSGQYRDGSVFNLSKKEIEKAFRAQEIIIVESVLKEGKFGFLTLFPDSIVNIISGVFTKIYWNFSNQFIMGFAYSHRTTYSDVVSNITKPRIFFVGMKNKVFDSSWQLECIQKYAPGSKVYKFEHSGHELMQTEPIKFIKCFKEAMNS